MKILSLLACLAVPLLPVMAGSPPVPALRVIDEVNVPPLLYDPEGFTHFLIAPDGVSATVTLDGSASFDPDGDPLAYFWGYRDFLGDHPLPLGDPNQVHGPFFTFPLVIHDPNYNYNFVFQVFDSVNAGSLAFGLYVMPPDEATELYLLAKLDQVEIEQGVHFRGKRALARSLTNATDEFRQGETRRAVRSLKRFQRMIHAQRRSLGKDLAEAFVALSQAVIGAVRSQQTE